MSSEFLQFLLYGITVGAIYALERIAQDSERDHIPVMETLCTYIRENAPPSGADDKGDDWPDWSGFIRRRPTKTDET